MDPIENLTKLMLELPEVSIPGGSYFSLNIRGNIASIAIQFYEDLGFKSSHEGMKMHFK